MRFSSVDVKATKYANGRLLALPWKADKGAEVFALLIGTLLRYRVAGIMRADELLAAGRMTDLGHGKTYAAEQQELDSWQELAA